MKNGENNLDRNKKIEIDTNLNAYSGKNLSPKKTDYVNSIADTIKKAISQYKKQTAE